MQWGELTLPAAEEEDGQDNLEPIDASNIITGSGRTRGKTIDYAEAAAKAKDAGDEDLDDDDEDEDFQAAQEDEQMQM